MEQKNKINFFAGLIVIVGILAFIFVVMLVYRNKKVIPQTSNQKVEEIQKKDDNDISKKEETEVREKSITGEIIFVDISTIKVKTEKEELTFSIPGQGAIFIEEEIQKNGDSSMKEIGLFEIPKNKKVEIKYNEPTKEVMSIVVK